MLTTCLIVLIFGVWDYHHYSAKLQTTHVLTGAPVAKCAVSMLFCSVICVFLYLFIFLSQCYYFPYNLHLKYYTTPPKLLSVLFLCYLVVLSCAFLFSSVSATIFPTIYTTQHHPSLLQLCNKRIVPQLLDICSLNVSITTDFVIKHWQW